MDLYLYPKAALSARSVIHFTTSNVSEDLGMLLCWRNVLFVCFLFIFRGERERVVTQLLGATVGGDRSCVFGTMRVVLLCNSLSPPHVREGGCVWKRNVCTHFPSVEK